VSGALGVIGLAAGPTSEIIKTRIDFITNPRILNIYERRPVKYRFLPVKFDNIIFR
jgi:hypothetical protein